MNKSIVSPIRPTIVANLNVKSPSVTEEGGQSGEPGEKTDKASRVVIATTNVQVRLLPIPALTDGAAVVARSMLDPDESRVIVINLNRGHVLVTRALARADSLLIRHLCAQGLSDFCRWFDDKRDGHAITGAIRSLCGIPRNAMLSQSAFSTRLATCEAFRTLDKIPIYGPRAKEGPFALFRFTVALRDPSDIPNWQVKHGCV
jgi:hypothetical protein